MIETSIYEKRLLTDLKDTIYLGYYYRNDLVELANNLMTVEGTASPGDNVKEAVKNSDNYRFATYKEIYQMWKKAKFNEHSMEWINYYPGIHFPQSLSDDIASYLRLNGIHRSWISRLNPGQYAPWHWDVDDHEQKFLEKGEIKRYSITMCQPTLGHILIVGRDYLYNAPAGSIFKWKNYKEWHVGINGGLSPKFTLHMLGY